MDTLLHRALDGDLPTPTAKVAAARPDQNSILKHPTEKEFLAQIAPKSVGDAPLPSFDPGIFNNELLKLELYPTLDPEDPHIVRPPVGNIVEGTYIGTQLALTQAYSRIEQTFSSLFDVLGIEPTLPRLIPLEEQKKLYQWSAYPKNADGTPASYPPHLQAIPKDQEINQFHIFSAIGLIETQVLLTKITPDEGGFLGKTKQWLLEKARATAFGGEPEKGVRIQDVVDYNKFHRKFGADITEGGNIGLLDDWYSDRRFADQSFTGTNPTTITKASKTWIDDFTKAAKAGGYDKWVSALGKTDLESLFVQDGSYFRKAFGVSDPAATLSFKPVAVDENWCVGAVTLFQLHEDGKLHPVAICIDHKGSMEKSVTIFNKRLSPNDSTSGEKDDWPWRYAKTCAQVTDWMRHELVVHLTLSHFVEEAVIVATNRTIPMDHPLYSLLSPHWYKTLSLNAAARASLVPQVVCDIIGVNNEQALGFARQAFDTYDFVGAYVPNDLKKRGFPNTVEGLKHPRYKNYTYAKNMVALWNVLRKYVQTMLSIAYPDDASVVADKHLQNWSQEVKTAGAMPSFPEMKTVDDLIDAATMCIHIAAPFHSAVNYLQQFYQTFVINKPASLCSPPPTTLDQLKAYKEPNLIASLPINRQRQWLLSAQVPWLLSFKVEDERSLINFAASQWSVYRYKKEIAEQKVRDASETLYRDLQGLQKTFFYNSAGMEKGSIPYMVLDPGLTAVSILI